MSQLDVTRNNPLNNSTSKQQYSFSKLDRFKQRIKTEGADTYYDIPNTRNMKCFSFGKTGRYDMFNLQCRLKNRSPPPGSYDLQTDIDKLLKKKEGVKITYGRECQSGNIFKTTDNPGPGAYNPNPEFTQSKLIHSVTLGKLPTSKRLVKEDPIPGPGTYQMNSLILNENKILSKDKKKAFGKLIFPESQSKRIKTESIPKLRLPQVNMKGDRTIKLDKGYSLGKSPRFKLKTLIDMPGPGAYSNFSEFIDSRKKK